MYIILCEKGTSSTTDPWQLQFSKSRKKLYFYNRMTKKGVFDPLPDSISTYQYV